MDRIFWKDLLEWEPKEDTNGQVEGNGEYSTDDEGGDEDIYTRIFRGDVQASLPPEKNSIRIFLSSTFNDYGKERNLLLKDVLPYVNSFGSRFGIDVVISEMRWGISDQAVEENRIIELCMNEIENCRNESIGPFFCLMLGNRYGYRAPPPMLSVSEYNDATKRAKEEQNERVLEALQISYRLDDNLEPSSYVLFAHTKINETDDKFSLLFNAIANLMKPVNDESSRAEDIAKDLLADFFDSPSVTEQEALNGFLNYDDNHSLWDNGVGVFHRHIENVGDSPSPIYYDNFKHRLDDLKSRSRCFAEANGCSYHQYHIPSLEELDMDRYLIEFSNDFCSWIVKSIQSKAINGRQRTSLPVGDKRGQSTSLLREISSHHDHTERAFVGRKNIVEMLVKHCENGTGTIVVRGASGTGKTTLLGQVAQKISTCLPNRPVILLRFLGTTPASSTSEAVAASMLHQLTMAYPDIASKALSKEDAVVMRPPARFLKLVRAISNQKKRIIMIIDSLDQLDSSDPGRDTYEQWLPTLFGPGALSNVAILLSALPDHLAGIEAMPFHHIEDLPHFTIDEGEDMLDHLCLTHNSGLEKKQRDGILKQFRNESSTLYLKIAFLQSVRWRSWDTDIQIPNTVKGQITLLFKQLRNDFGINLVASVISHLTLTPGGINVEELCEAVSMDDEVLKEVFRWHETPDLMVPPLLVIEIIGRLEPYLSHRRVDDLETRCWYHRAFWEAAEVEFLTRAEWRSKVHSEAIELYSKQPTHINANRINCRKMRQLPYRLREIEDWAALGNFLSNNPEALMIELKSEGGKARYASYWRSLKEGTHNNTMYDIETALPAFAMSESELMTLDHVFLIGDFLKEYFNAYEAALSVFRVVLRSGSDESIFNDNFRIKDSRELDCMSRIGDVYTRLSKYDEACKWLSKSYSEMKR
jgi:hypothetical protein